MGLLVAYPLVMILYGGFWSSSPGAPGHLTLNNYVQGFAQPGVIKALLTTFWVGALVTLISSALGIAFAWIIARTNTPGRKWLEIGFWIYFFMPFMPMAISWVLLLGPEFGLVNQALKRLPFINHSTFNVYSYWGIIWAQVQISTSFIVLLVTPAFRRMEASLEESARMSGASTFTTLRQITVPILMPAITGVVFLSFIRSVESFESPLILGYPARIFVYTTKVYQLLEATHQFGPAMAMTNVFLVVLLTLIFIQRRLLNRQSYTTIGGRGFTIRPASLGRWRYVTLAFCLTWMVVGTLLPLMTLIFGSFMKAFGVFVPEPFTMLNWSMTFKDPYFWVALKNTMLLALITATGGMLLYTIIAYVGIKTLFRGRKALDFITWLPWSVPSMVLALGILWAYVGGVRLPFTLYGTLWIMVLALAVEAMPIGVRSMNAGLVQLSKELEESSRVHGATFLRTLRSIVIPLLAPTFVATWIIIFLGAARDLSTVILLYSPKSRLLSVLTMEYWTGAMPERALVLGIITSAIALILALAARALGGRQDIKT